MNRNITSEESVALIIIACVGQFILTNCIGQFILTNFIGQSILTNPSQFMLPNYYCQFFSAMILNVILFTCYRYYKKIKS